MARARRILLQASRSPRLNQRPGRLAKPSASLRARDTDHRHLTLQVRFVDWRRWLSPGKIEITPRIGISKATDRRLRYILAGNRSFPVEKRPPETKDRRGLENRCTLSLGSSARKPLCSRHLTELPPVSGWIKDRRSTNHDRRMTIRRIVINPRRSANTSYVFSPHPPGETNHLTK